MTIASAIIHVESPYVLRNLKDRLLKRRNELADHVADGGCNSYEQYRELVGTMAGLLAAIDILDELEKKERN